MSGTHERPRFDVYRSNQHIYVQIIDDLDGKTLVAASTVEKEIAAEVKGKKKTEAAKIVGAAAAKKHWPQVSRKSFSTVADTFTPDALRQLPTAQEKPV